VIQGRSSGNGGGPTRKLGGSVFKNESTSAEGGWGGDDGGANGFRGGFESELQCPLISVNHKKGRET